MRRIMVGDFLTDEQGEQVVTLWQEHGATAAFIDAVVKQVIHPSIEGINRRCGQRMDELHIAYVIKHTLLTELSGDDGEIKTLDCQAA